MGRFAVFDCIGNCFLNDTKEMRGDSVVRHFDRFYKLKATDDVKKFRGVGCQFLKRGHQTLGFERHWRKPARQRSCMRYGVAYVAGNLGDLLGMFSMLVRKLLRDSLTHELNPCQLLAEAVVQILSDAALFAV